MNLETATLGGGCFWCTEAIFKRLKGVVSVMSGYAGGTGGENSNPSYDQVSMGTTGHAESIQIKFDPSIISYEKILDVFFATHDPTTLNRQGADIGTQYRSIIFYHSAKQKQSAEESKEKLEKSAKFNSKIVTEILPFSTFYKAEEYHQSFYEKNQTSAYCQIVINPKIQKLLKEFKNDVT
ncbi:MAG: peptide-methionine (S)-S-oxide reductase MsrA [Candidatus Levybacteria bacterium]|nr:peptide-methionine (S)-S-oxide reductase MsrA [Candidatus Levybacteria bacterium]